MSNTKEVRIIADVPFDYLGWHDPSEKRLPAEEQAALAGALMAPSTGLWYAYGPSWTVPNSKGGRTTMYRLEIGGEEAMATVFLRRLAMALKNSGEFAKLHIAEARDLEFTDHEPWEHIVAPGELSGEAQS